MQQPTTNPFTGASTNPSPMASPRAETPEEMGERFAREFRERGEALAAGIERDQRAMLAQLKDSAASLLNQQIAALLDQQRNIIDQIEALALGRRG